MFGIFEWKRNSSKCHGESESSASVSSHSERCSDDQESFRDSPNNTSARHNESPEISSYTCDDEVHETVKELTEKLSAALLDISAKEDLIKQNAKVAEEAVSGWEQAEVEVAALKQQLETSVQKNFALEDKLNQLDEALKERVRQLCQSREEQEQIHCSISKKTHEWESEKRVFEKQLLELKNQLEVATDHGIKGRLEALEQENISLKVKLLPQSEDVHVLLLERELSNKAAEITSKHHLDSMKKVSKLEAQCHQLQIANKRLSSVCDHRPIATLFLVESLTDTQSDNGERLLGMDNGPAGCSDSWVSVLIDELDQFKSEKANSRITCPSEIALMDDFLYMERLVAFHETNCGSSYMKPETNSNQVASDDSSPNVSDGTMHHRLIDLEEKVGRLEHEKAELKISLAELSNRLEESFSHLKEAENIIVELKTELDLAKVSEQIANRQVADLEGTKKTFQTQLESAHSENQMLRERISLLEESSEAERLMCVELKARIEISEASRQVLNSQLESSDLELCGLTKTVEVLEDKIKSERAFSSDLAAKIEALEVTRKSSECQLEIAHSEVNKLQDKVSFWELKAEEQMILYAEFAVKLEAMEAEKKKLELELISAQEFAAKAHPAEAGEKALEIQLDSAYIEAESRRDKLSLLEHKIDDERVLSAEFATKCHKREDVMSNIKKEADLHGSSSFNRYLKIKQEDIALASGKLEACRKTIASLNQQLKSLTNLDEFMVEAERT
ncbi:filament-like plant protein 3 [Canna indica]|uniref:Filament-like plant protein 3 n=1 Tax=Canna indica TaxID=4628 RepID=A0AAQ3KQ91_9LILI|nr:filament-like plant protein 3 [Canna indica]